MISSKHHGYLDYLTVIFFLAAPSLFGLSEAGSYISYLLAGIHLLLTLVTRFPMGLLKKVPFQFHGYVELIVGLVLLGGPWIINGIFNGTDRMMFSVAGGVILIVWILTSYRTQHS